MVALTTIRAHNPTLKSLSPNLVAIFVGGTSGIGLSTAREFARNTEAPHIYLVGRNQTEATRIIAELQEINPSSQLNFIKSDTSLLRNVDDVCRQITEKETKVNLLFMTVGYVTMDGRQETTEGLDRKFSLHYYARMRFVQNLAPLLTTAAQSQDPKARLSRVVSVLDPHVTGPLNFADLSLKHNFSLKKCADHAKAMGNFALEHFAHQMPETSFVHSQPGVVNTGALRGLGPVLNGVFKVSAVLLKPLMVNLTESGERHLYVSTAPVYAPKAGQQGVKGVAQGSDGVSGSGVYAVNWQGEAVEQSKQAIALRADGAEKKIWEHTEDVFEKICKGEGRY